MNTPIYRDKVYVKESNDDNVAVESEGTVQRVDREEVTLRFSDSFLLNFKSEKRYDVRFTFTKQFLAYVKKDRKESRNFLNIILQ